MLRARQQSPLAAKRAARGRIAIIAMLLIIGLGVGAASYASGAVSERETALLEAMERGGRIVLAFDHDDNELGAVLDNTSERYYKVTVVADGAETEVQVTSRDTVDEILRKAKISVGFEDEMSHFPGRTVSPGERIVIERLTRDTHIQEKEIPYETTEIASSLLSPGKQRIVLEGTNGISNQTFERVLLDGVVVEQTLVSETIVKQPVNRKLLTGANYAAVSPLDFEWKFDESGVPVDYADVLQSKRAAGYSARAGAGTACGYLKAAVGHVAVNPNVIPYGSKLYICSTDGRFVYGYAIAADTGTGLMQGVIDVDLFYATYEESRLNGMRQVDIYILEYPK